MDRNLYVSERRPHTAERSKIQSLDAFRGIAAICIVLYHSRFYSDTAFVPFIRHSDILVDFFFVLSGFVVAYSYADRIGSEVSFRKFILLRLGRLYPLHLFFLIMWLPYIALKVIVYGTGTGDTNPVTDNNFLTFISNLFLIQSVDGYLPLSWNYPAWSISAEFGSYLFFFAFVLIFLKVGSLNPRTVVPWILLTSGCAYALTWAFDGHGVELFFFEAVGGFFLGVLIYFLYRIRPFVPAHAAWATVLETMVLAVAIFCVVNKTEQGFRDNAYFYICIVSFIAVIYLFSAQNVGYVSQLLKAAPFQFLGRISYSVYMAHALVLAVMENLFVYVFKFTKTSFGGLDGVIVFDGANYVNIALLTIVIGVSAITYMRIEMPWRRRFRELAEKHDAILR